MASVSTGRLWVDPEFQSLIPPLTQGEFAQLEANLKAEGCRDALVVWGDTIVDGHNRHSICTHYGIRYDVHEVEFSSRDEAKLWIVRNQLGRRNLAPFQRIELALVMEPLIAAKAKEKQRTSTGGSCPQLLPTLAEAGSVDTREEVAKAANVSHGTLAKAKVIIEKTPEVVKEKLRRNEVSINKVYSDIKKSEKRAPTIEPVFTNGGVVDSLATLIEAGRKFHAIYADPPWRYGNQATRASTDNHYDTMTVDQICAEPVAQLVEENAHLHLWTTNAFLFDARRVIEAWGFTYKSCFVWVKPQMGIGNYWRVSHEFLLFGIRGKLPFRCRDEMSWGAFPRSEHSSKPDAIRMKIERVSPGPYLEMYGRISMPGTSWTVYGNQIDKRLF